MEEDGHIKKKIEIEVKSMQKGKNTVTKDSWRVDYNRKILFLESMFFRPIFFPLCIPRLIGTTAAFLSSAKKIGGNPYPLFTFWLEWWKCATILLGIWRR
jgi:hypothetical protein